MRVPSHQQVQGPTDFSAFYREHANRVLIYLARRCLDPEVALDLMAETFAQAYASRGRYRGRSEAEAAGWIFAIARHQLAHYLRRGRAEQKALRRLGLQAPTLSGDDMARIDELAGLAEIRRALAGHLERLSSEQRDALRLRVLDELSYAEVARELGVSEDAARARVSRGLHRLAASLDGAVIEEGGAAP